MPVLLFMAAGALLFGGGALLDRAKRAHAREEAKDRQRLEREILQGAIDLDDLRREAIARGLDPETTVKGYLALSDGTTSIEEVVRFLASS